MITDTIRFWLILACLIPSNTLIEDFYECTVFFSYFVILLFPFVCACSLPQFKVRVNLDVV